MTQVAGDGVGFKAIEEISCRCDILVFGSSGRNPFKPKYILPDNFSKAVYRKFSLRCGWYSPRTTLQSVPSKLRIHVLVTFDLFSMYFFKLLPLISSVYS